MKKLIISSFVFALVFSFAGVAHGEDKCGDTKLNHPAFEVVTEDTSTVPSTFSTTTVPALNNISCGNGSPELVVSPWGKMNSEVPHIQPGQSSTDEAGITETCPAWFPFYCVDITRTEYYRTRMKNLAAELVMKNQISQFLKMQGWVGR